MDKNIVIKVAGATEPKEAAIHPGTTCRDLLDALNLDRSLLVTQDPAGVPFGIDENIFEKVAEGQKLYCVPAMEVGG